MKILKSLIFVLSALLVWNVQAEEANPPLKSITSEDDWFDGSMDTKEVYCHGEVDGRNVFVYIYNATTNDLVFNRTVNDFSYAVKYKNATNETCVLERVCMIERHMGRIEVLYGQDRLRCDCMYSTDFRFELPKDCVHVESVAVEFELIHVPEIGKCRTASDLRALFLKNKFRKVVDFGKDEGQRKARKQTIEPARFVNPKIGMNVNLRLY